MSIFSEMCHSEPKWGSPPANFTINDNEVHLWQASLDQSGSHIQELERLLCPAEKLRAGKFVFDKHRRRFIAGRGFLRSILGGYLNQSATSLEFSYGPQGKPALVSPDIHDKLYFNVSHSHEIALYAISRNRQVGVDVEYLRAKRGVESIAQHYFYPAECKVIDSLPAERKKEAFFKAWTVKEAYAKATGEGLSVLEQVETSLSPNGPAALLNIHGNSGAMARWSSRQIHFSPDYMAALVVEGRDWRLRCVMHNSG
ncbi:MAG: 4'-phosphopantetheinyl transferase superfamily protein [Gammaproteobacteria bacterium]|nr:4'-phosphopantetheinyl transferase superfamily protein [Gammaproteobacteria bacterium]MCF6260400.1 4'-phosphopantetheinyl transferase superfamily protein [Gammaproteobacteria bacterium]